MAQSDDIGRHERIADAARQIFGDHDFADRWLKNPNPALGNQVPIEMAATDGGARLVESVLSRIAYGDYS